MAGILKHGPRNAPKFYIQFDRGYMPAGSRVRSTRLLKGVENIFQARRELARVEREVAAGQDPFPEPVFVPLTAGSAGPTLRQWAETLKNRNARDDRSRITRYLLPRFGKTKVEQITLPVVMTWIDSLSTSELSPQSQRHLLGLLSRFFSWCIERGLATANPVRMAVGEPSSPDTIALISSRMEGSRRASRTSSTSAAAALTSWTPADVAERTGRAGLPLVVPSAWVPSARLRQFACTLDTGSRTRKSHVVPCVGAGTRRSRGQRMGALLARAEHQPRVRGRSAPAAAS